MEILDKPDELRARQLGVHEDSLVRSVSNSAPLDDLLDAAQKAYDDYLAAIHEVNEIHRPEM